MFIVPFRINGFTEFCFFPEKVFDIQDSELNNRNFILSLDPNNYGITMNP